MVKTLVNKNIEKKVFEAMGLHGQDHKIAANKLGIHPNTVENYKTKVFQRFISDLNLLIDLYSVFERRFKREDEAYSKLRQLARKIKREA